PAPPQEFRGTTPRNSGGPNLISRHSYQSGVRISYGFLLHESARTGATRRPSRSPCLSRYGRGTSHEIPDAGTDVRECYHPYLHSYLFVRLKRSHTTLAGSSRTPLCQYSSAMSPSHTRPSSGGGSPFTSSSRPIVWLTSSR